MYNNLQLCKEYINDWYYQFDPKGQRLMFSASIDYTTSEYIDIIIQSDGKVSYLAISSPKFKLNASKVHD